MKIKAKLVSRGAAGLAAGKLAVAPTVANAALGKTDQSAGQDVPVIGLDQIGFPLDLLSPPVQGFEQGASDAVLSKAGESASSNQDGVIYQGEQRYAANNGMKPRIDFIVNGIRNDMPMHVFLLFSTKPPLSEPTAAWQQNKSGQISLDPVGLKIIEWIVTSPTGNIPTPEEFSPGVLGTTPERVSSSATIPFELGDLSAEELKNGIWFQAAAVPMSDSGDFLLAESQATEVDRFVIDYVREDDYGTKGNTANPVPASTDGGNSKTGGGGTTSGGSGSIGGK